MDITLRTQKSFRKNFHYYCKTKPTNCAYSLCFYMSITKTSRFQNCVFFFFWMIGGYRDQRGYKQRQLARSKYKFQEQTELISKNAHIYTINIPPHQNILENTRTQAQILSHQHNDVVYHVVSGILLYRLMREGKW